MLSHVYLQGQHLSLSSNSVYTSPAWYGKVCQNTRQTLSSSKPNITLQALLPLLAKQFIEIVPDFREIDLQISAGDADRDLVIKV